MYAEREMVVRALRSRGDHDRALQAQCSLPQWVDLEQDAGLLQQVDVEVSELDVGRGPGHAEDGEPRA